MSLQPLEHKALSWGIIRKSACILAEITIRKSQERALKEALDPSEPQKVINLECKMNLARAEGTHTHWHMLPRYRNPITLTDPETGEALIFGSPREQ